MHWNVFMEDFNHSKIAVYDVLDNQWIMKEFARALKNSNGSKDAFAKEIRRILMYNYWSRCEYEISLTCWPPECGRSTFNNMKVDVFQQIILNWEAFVDYVWARRGEFANNEKDALDADELDAMFDNGVDLLAEVGVDG